MTDNTRYQVVGHVAHVKVNSPRGPVWTLLPRGGIVPQDADPDRLRHLLSVKLIAPAGVWPDSEPGWDGPLLAQPDPAPEATTPVPVVDEETAARREAARAELPPDGSPPPGNAKSPVIVEYLAGKGWDYDALVREDRAGLLALLKSAK